MVVVAFLLTKRLVEKWLNAAIRKNNAAHEAFVTGDLARAESMSSEVATSWVADQMTAYCLYRLGAIAIRRGAFERAAKLFAAAGALERRRRLARAFGNLTMTASSDEAMALACLGRLEEARTTIAEVPQDDGGAASSRALRARSLSLIAWKAGDARGALATIASARDLLRNALAVDDAALVDAIEALAREAAGEDAHAVAVDAESRSYVLRLLPEAETKLVEDW